MSRSCAEITTTQPGPLLSRPCWPPTPCPLLSLPPPPPQPGRRAHLCRRARQRPGHALHRQRGGAEHARGVADGQPCLFHRQGRMSARVDHTRMHCTNLHPNTHTSHVTRHMPACPCACAHTHLDSPLSLPIPLVKYNKFGHSFIPSNFAATAMRAAASQPSPLSCAPLLPCPDLLSCMPPPSTPFLHTLLHHVRLPCTPAAPL